MPEANAQTPPNCEFCNKQGLVVLPVRYAIANGDSPAPEPGFPESESATAVDLGVAKYTTRSLRGGFLYVYDEAKDLWDGYYITPGNYLYKFDLDLPQPNFEKIRFTCSRNTHGLIASCVTIDDPDNASKVWFGFSDVPWTDAVLERHQSAAERDKHMRCLDVAAWLASHNQPHAKSMDQLDSTVADYAVDGAEAKLGFRWSNADFWGKHNLAARLKVTANRVSPGDALLLALDDAPGIAQDLSGMMQYRLEAFMKDDKRAWPLATSAAIDSLKQVIQAQAVKDEIEAGEYLANQQLANSGAAMIIPSVRDRIIRETEKLRDITPEEAERAKENAWVKYRDQYDESKHEEFKNKFQSELHAFEQTSIAPLANAHALWMQTPTIANAFACNFDPANIGSGLLYEKLFLRCAQYTSDKGPCRSLYRDWIDGVMTEPSNLLLRAMALNNDEIANKIEQAASGDIPLSKYPWESLFSVYAEALDTAAEMSGASWTEKLARSDDIVKFMLHMGGPIASVFDDGLHTAPTPGMRRMAIATGGRVGRPVIEITVKGGKKAFRAELIRQMLSLTDQRFSSPHKMQRAVSEQLRQLEAQGVELEGTQQKRWLLLVDEDYLRNPPSNFAQMDANGRAQYLAGALDTPENLGKLTKPGWRGMLNTNTRLAAVGLLLQSVSLMNAAGDKRTAMAHESSEAGKRLWSTRGLIMGSLGEAIGSATESTRWGQFSVGQKLFSGLARSELFSVAGRGLGSIAGFAMAAMDGMKALEERAEGNTTMFALYAASSAGGFLLGAGILLGLISGGVAIIIMLALVGIGMLIELFKENKLQEWLERCQWGELPEIQRYQSSEEELKQLKAALG